MDLIPIDVTKNDTEYTRWLCQQLERGNILLLDPTPFAPSPEECSFLRDQKQMENASHKNIAYKPHLRKVTGADTKNEENVERMRRILAGYSEGAVAFLARMLPEYAKMWKVDYASFRPVEEQGRNLPIRHRNDLMHLDAFPTRPTYGGRILRTFTNIHPDRDRVWGTSYTFEELAKRYAVDAGLMHVSTPLAAARRRVSTVGRLFGMRVPNRSAYDEFMLRFHHYLKSNTEFQQTGQQHSAAFPPGASWITFTDQVAHKALSGQYALEQTCIIPYRAMLMPELAPVAVLERLAGRQLVSREALEAASRTDERVPA